MIKRTTSMPIGVRNAFLLNAVIAFLLSIASVAITKSIEPHSTIWAAVAVLGTCTTASAVHLLRCWPRPEMGKVKAAEFLIGLSSYAFCALAAAVGALCASTSTFDATFTSLAICILAIPAFHVLRMGTDGATTNALDAVIARQRLRLLPMAQAACFYAVMVS